MSFFWSECGQYICRKIVGPYAFWEAWTTDGSIHWRHDNRVRTWEDARKPRHPMAYAGGSWSCQQTGQKKGSFTLGLLHCDTAKFIESGMGNTIINNLTVVFRRKIPPQNVPRWLKEATFCDHAIK